jgi:hypothetical protein
MAELVSKTASAVAVTDALTALLDWVNIEQVSGFTIIVNNAGGGSANDISDVQIDTSNDGGVTASLDQHAGVPAVPIASGKASQGTFTQTAKFVRVRAVCAEGEDATATAALLADTSVGRLCTLTDIKLRLGLTTTDNDQLLARIVAGIEPVFNRYTRRYLIANAVDVTEYFTGCGNRLLLNRYPVISITSIKISSIYDFDNETALVANSGYRIVAGGKNGIVFGILYDWPDIPDAIQVVYRGGYCAAGQTPGSGEYALPDDLREAAIEQASFLFKRKDDLGLSSVSIQGGSISKFSDLELLPLVRQILDSYKRPPLL